MFIAFFIYLIIHGGTYTDKNKTKQKTSDYRIFFFAKALYGHNPDNSKLTSGDFFSLSNSVILTETIFMLLKKILN